jgi:hypothetical protein
MAFDLNSLALSTGTFELQLRHPVSDELLFADEEKTQPVKISLYGTSSKQFRNASTANQNAYIKRGKKPLTAEGVQESRIELLVACSDKGINIQYQGNPIEDADSFRALYGDPQMEWVKDQCDAAIGEVSNFLV